MAAIPAMLAQQKKGKNEKKSMILLEDADIELIQTEFAKADSDGSGALGEGEMQHMWRNVFPHMPIKELREMADAMYQDLDPNKDGYVSWPEFESFFRKLSDRSHWTEIDYLVNGIYLDRAPTHKELVWQIVDLNNLEYAEIPNWVAGAQQVVFWSMNGMLLISIGVLIVESMDDTRKLHGRHSKTFPLEAFCMLVFSAEFVARLFSAPDLRKFLRNMYTVIDALLIMPFYIGCVDDRGSRPMASMGDGASPGLVFLRVVWLARLLRVLRTVRIGSQFESVQVLAIAVWRMLTSLLVSLIGVNSAWVVLVSGVMCVAERHQATYDEDFDQWIRLNESDYVDAGQPILFQSIPLAMWWSLVTLTTIGYGDMTPVTRPGKGIAAVSMIINVVLMAFPLTLLASSFGKAHDELEKKKDAKKRSRIFTAQLKLGKQLNELHGIGGAAPAVAKKPFMDTEELISVPPAPIRASLDQAVLGDGSMMRESSVDWYLRPARDITSGVSPSMRGGSDIRRQKSPMREIPGISFPAASQSQPSSLDNHFRVSVSSEVDLVQTGAENLTEGLTTPEHPAGSANPRFGKLRDKPVKLQNHPVLIEMKGLISEMKDVLGTVQSDVRDIRQPIKDLHSRIAEQKLTLDSLAARSARQERQMQQLLQQGASAPSLPNGDPGMSQLLVDLKQAVSLQATALQALERRSARQDGLLQELVDDGMPSVAVMPSSGGLTAATGK